MNKLSIDKVDVKGKRVFIRVDFNVPMKEGKITNNVRIVEALPTIKYVLEHGAKSVVLASHLGRPDGKIVAKDSLKPVSEELERLGIKNTFLPDCVGPEVEKACADPAEGTVFLLENLRFHIEEEGKSPTEKADPEKVKEFRASLRRLGDIYCCDAFGTAHRAHSSMVGDGYEVRCSGFLLKKEIDYFRIALHEPKRPYLAILGGAKVSDKILLIENLLDKVDELIICGGMSYTFAKMNGISIGTSLFDEPGSKVVERILEKAKERNVKLHLPVDALIADKFDNEANTKIVNMNKEEGIPDGWMGLDVGPKTVELFREVIGRAHTIVWNGPCGVFEMPSFAKGSNALLDMVCKATANGATTIIGGGDSATLAINSGRGKEIGHISTGGGAAIELLQGNKMPGIESLCDL